MDELVASEVDLMMLQGLTKLKVPGNREGALTNATSSTELTEDSNQHGCALQKSIHKILIHSRT